jgi:CENP-B N-terminal DNA-binding domain
VKKSVKVVSKRPHTEESSAAIEETPLSVAEFAKRLGLKMSTAYKLLAHEPDVKRIYLSPGSSRPVIRVPVAVLERIERRSANPG